MSTPSEVRSSEVAPFISILDALAVGVFVQLGGRVTSPDLGLAIEHHTRDLGIGGAVRES